jgi:hypothetical protein
VDIKTSDPIALLFHAPTPFVSSTVLNGLVVARTRNKKLGYALRSALKGPSGSSHHVIYGLGAPVSIDVCHEQLTASIPSPKGGLPSPYALITRTCGSTTRSWARRTFLVDQNERHAGGETPAGRNADVDSSHR